MLYFRVKFEANNEPMYLGTRRGIEMWSAYAGGELFTETEVKNNDLNYDFLIPVNVNQRKTRMMGRTVCRPTMQVSPPGIILQTAAMIVSVRSLL